jgi:predicted ATPase
MIQKISVENYKSIKSLQDFELKPINVLIGANNSGKSNFLDVFAFLRDTLVDEISQEAQGKSEPGWRGALQKRGGGESICFGNEPYFKLSCLSHPFRYSLEFALDQFGQNYQIRDEQLIAVNAEKKFFEPQDGKLAIYDESGKSLGVGDRGVRRTALGTLGGYRGVDPQALTFARQLSEIKIYDRIHTEPWSPIRMPQIPKGETILDEDGGNLVGVLFQLSQTYPRFLSELNSLLKILYRDFSRISFPSNRQGELLIRWEDKTGRIIHTPQLSDGTLKFLCLIAILKNPDPPPLIGIDEPDTKLHPRMTGILADIIDQTSSRTQIIATTHSPDFVSMFNPEQIVILQQYRGETEIRRLSDRNALDLWLQDFTIRKLWLMGELESRW